MQTVASRSSFAPSTKALQPKKVAAKFATRQVVKAAAAGADVPDMGKRNTMNLLLLGAVGAPASALAGGFVYFLVPPSAGGAGGGVVAKDKIGNDVRLLTSCIDCRL